MVPETLRKPWSAGLIATLSASLVLLQTSDDPQWIAAVWTGAVVFCVLVHGRLGAHLERIFAPEEPTAFSKAAPIAMSTLWLVVVVMSSVRPAVGMFLVGIWFARWPPRKYVWNDPFDWRAGLIIIAFGLFYSFAIGPWEMGVLIAASVWLIRASLFSGFARHIRPIQSRVPIRIAVLFGVGALVSALVLLTPKMVLGAYILLTAAGMWFGRWFLADPAIDAEPVVATSVTTVQGNE